MLTRRQFLTAASALAATVLAPAMSRAASRPSVGAPSAKPFSGELSDFEAYVGQNFSMSAAEAHTVQVRLAEVTVVPGAAELESFTVRFEGAPEAAVPEGMHILSHPACGQFPLYVTRECTANGCANYLAVFSRVTG